MILNQLKNLSKKLINETSEYYDENQIFRIDHYLAKETVQNILNFRFNNAIFESLWDHFHISLIEIYATETIGIEGRANFYDKTGALRDIIQSHLLQLMAIVTMEEPLSFSSVHIHHSKLALLKYVKQINAADVDSSSLRGQYQTYKDEVKNPDTNTETFAAIKLIIDNPRWENVPIVLKTGKSLNEKKTAVTVLFKRNDRNEEMTQHNSLSFRIQPNEGIDIGIIVKKPGLDNELEAVDMDFSYSRFFAADTQRDAYERVLVDAIRGDHTLFATSEEVIATWEIVDQVLLNWSKDGRNLQIYNNNSSGPQALPDWLKSDYKS
jgi:glucose-6-phosphate 1-dehydrogenase